MPWHRSRRRAPQDGSNGSSHVTTCLSSSQILLAEPSTTLGQGSTTGLQPQRYQFGLRFLATQTVQRRMSSQIVLLQSCICGTRRSVSAIDTRVHQHTTATHPVAFTKALNRRLLTEYLLIRNGLSLTFHVGPSRSSGKKPSSEPMKKNPPCNPMSGEHCG